MLILEHIEKSYDRPVLQNITWSFEAGGLYVIKGISGSGKSTLLNIIGGLERLDGGNILLDGRDVTGKSILRERSAYVFQQSLLLSGITIMDNLLLIRNDSGRIRELAASFYVQELLEKLPVQLSGGERQRISIIRALLQEPELLLADEPTASLDEENSVHIAGMLAGLREYGKTIIVATHEPYFDELADEILYLNYGKLENKTRGRDTKQVSG